MARPGLPLKVKQVEQLGSETILHGTTGADESVVVAQYGQVPFAPGETLHIDPENTPLFLFADDGARIDRPAAKRGKA